MTPWIPDEDYAALLERVAALENRKLKFADLPYDELIQKLSTESSFKGRELLLKKSVGTDLLALDSVTEDQLAPDSVGSSEIAADAVGTDERAVIPAALVTHSANQAISSGVTTTLAFDTELYDTAALHDSGGNTKLTVPVAGKYLVYAGTAWGASAAYRQTDIRLNGTTSVARASQTSDGVTNPFVVLDLEAGDYLEVRVYVAAAVSVLAASEYSPLFGAVWLSK